MLTFCLPLLHDALIVLIGFHQVLTQSHQSRFVASGKFQLKGISFVVSCRILDDHMVVYGTEAGAIGASPSSSASAFCS